jgi:glycolate oxidase
MPFEEVSEILLTELEAIVGKEFTIVDEEKRRHYSHDETEDFSFLPDVVVKPGSTEQVSAIMLLCNKYCVPVTPRGGGTGLSGGAIPVH